MRFLRGCSVMDRTPASCRSAYWQGLVSVLLVVCVLVGCSTSNVPDDGLEVDIDALVSKPISRDAVIQKLGPPLVSLEQGAILTYRIAHSSEFLNYYVTSRKQQGRRNEYSLVLVFDSQGLLQKHSLVEVYKRHDDS